MPVLRTRDPTGGSLRGTNLRTRNTGTQISTYLPESRWANHVEGWHFDEASNATRVGLKGRDMIDVGSDVTQTAGKLGNSAYIFDSTLELRCTTNDFRIGGDFTITCWIYPNDTWGPPNEPVMRYVDGTTNVDWELYSNSQLWFRLFDSVTGSQQQFVENDWTVGTWHHLVLLYDSTAKIMRAVLDNDLANDRQTTALTNGLRQGGTRLRLGDSAGGATGLLWRIDEMHIFRSLKDDTWIADMNNEGNGRVFPD